jgi:preprotein translocase subunit YajC
MNQWVFFIAGALLTAVVMFAIEEFLIWRERRRQ